MGEDMEVYVMGESLYEKDVNFQSRNKSISLKGYDDTQEVEGGDTKLMDVLMGKGDNAAYDVPIKVDVGEGGDENNTSQFDNEGLGKITLGQTRCSFEDGCMQRFYDN